nr:DNA cytosine methyltransferase [uncultured Campylobacter sp.]
MKISAIDLFCGVGGLTYGLQSSGIKVKAGIDLDASCKFVYETNNRTDFIHKSVKDVEGSELNNIFGDCDVKILVGCAPCQPFSRHQKNKKNRSSHKDWGLLYEFSRLIKQTKPQIVSMENVPSLKNEKVFFDFTKDLADMGYDVTYRVHDASDYGVPQRRLRLLLLASKIGKINFIDSKMKKVTVEDAIKNLPQISAGGMKNADDPLHISSALSPINVKRIKQSKPGGTWEDWDTDILPECYKKPTGKSYKSVYGRMTWSDAAPTLTTQFYNYGTGRFGHPEQDRAISLREGALLQSFPKDYVFFKNEKDISMKKLARYIGNAVPPKLGEHIGRSIKAHLKTYNVFK